MPHKSPRSRYASAAPRFGYLSFFPQQPDARREHAVLRSREGQKSRGIDIVVDKCRILAAGNVIKPGAYCPLMSPETEAVLEMDV